MWGTTTRRTCRGRRLRRHRGRSRRSGGIRCSRWRRPLSIFPGPTARLPYIPRPSPTRHDRRKRPRSPLGRIWGVSTGIVISLSPQQSVNGGAPLASGLGHEVSIVTKRDSRGGVPEPSRQRHHRLPCLQHDRRIGVPQHVEAVLRCGRPLPLLRSVGARRNDASLGRRRFPGAGVPRVYRYGVAEPCGEQKG
jgi:hypothetical protein